MKFILILILLGGCANQLLKQAPKLAPAETFYIFEQEEGKISHNRCKKLNGANRKCTKTIYDMKAMWPLFFPGHIIIKKEKVF